uniref:LAMP family protein lmp-1 n=1 Tax=Parastrongyloides trichosuri TaxID=131310 RepID=A0A0N4Z5B9_PARTI
MRLLILFFVLLGVIYGDVYTAKTKNGTYCIVLEANITGTIYYNKMDVKKLVEYKFTVPHGADSSGDCKGPNENQILNINFKPEEKEDLIWNINLMFTKNPDVKDKSFKLVNYHLNTDFSNSSFFNSTQPKIAFKKTGEIFEWESNRDNTAYQCSTVSLDLETSSKIDFKNLRVIAEEELKNPYFKNDTIFSLCAADTMTSDVVPIVVGACLTGLVVAVLIAYLIGRHKAKRQGYASV